MWFSRLPAVFAVVLALGVPGGADAATVSSISGTWTGSDPIVSGIGTDRIRWGKSTGYGKSGYNFDAAATPLEADPEEYFTLGTFTHLNKPITGKLLESAQLTVNFTFAGLDKVFSSVFNFDHWETKNNASTCANGQKNGSGINSNGCADRVTASLWEGLSDVFEIEGITYVLDVVGFMYHDEPMESFWTREKARNSAELIGVIRAVENPTPVPVPATGVLLASALAGMAFARRRVRKSA